MEIVPEVEGAETQHQVSALRWFVRCFAIAVCAALLGSLAGALIYIAYAFSGSPLPRTDGISIGSLSFVLLLVWLTACVVAIPASVILGTPMLFVFRSMAARFPSLTASFFAITGAAAALRVNHILSRNSVFPDRDLGLLITFGSVVAATHVILFDYWRRGSFRHSLAVIAITGTVAAAGGRAMLDEIRNSASEAQFVAECRVGHAVVVRAGAELDEYLKQRRQRRIVGRPSTRVRDEWFGMPDQALLHRHGQKSAGPKRLIIINDVAYAPYALFAHLGFDRRVKRHCLSELGGPEAELARQIGLVQVPRSAPPLAPF